VSGVALMGRRNRRSRILESQAACSGLPQPPAARFNIPLTLKRTELALAGRSKTQMSADITAAFDKKEFPALEPGAMCYMLSKQGYLNDSGGHWHPHLMFFIPLTDSVSWGTGLPVSPVVVAFTDIPERHTIFLVSVSKWPDGTPAPTDEHRRWRGCGLYLQPAKENDRGAAKIPYSAWLAFRANAGAGGASHFRPVRHVAEQIDLL
jgi:hypothetical protein